MGTNKSQLKTYIDEINYEKFKEIAAKDGRSISNMLEQLVKKHIEAYEQEHGTIYVSIYESTN